MFSIVLCDVTGLMTWTGATLGIKYGELRDYGNGFTLLRTFIRTSVNRSRIFQWRCSIGEPWEWEIPAVVLSGKAEKTPGLHYGDCGGSERSHSCRSLRYTQLPSSLRDPVIRSLLCSPYEISSPRHLLVPNSKICCSSSAKFYFLHP